MIRTALDWQTRQSYSDIRYEFAEGIARITIDRPKKRNAFRPETVKQLIDAFHRAHHDNAIGAIILTEEMPARWRGAACWSRAKTPSATCKPSATPWMDVTATAW